MLAEIAFQPLALKNSFLHVEVIPALGGKISSLRLLPDGTELLQPPLRPYASHSRDMTRTMSFDQGDASGFDECLPSVSPCILSTAGGHISIPDHGDFWRIEWQAGVASNRIQLSAEGFSLPLRFEKTLHLDDSTLKIDYRVTNTGDLPAPRAWSAHPLFAVDAGDRIVVPGHVEQVTVEGSAADRLGKAGAAHNWPLAIQSDGRTTDLSVAGGPDDLIGDKIYMAAPREGWCALERCRLKTRIEVRFNPDEIPWLGLWLCYGGWPEAGPVRQQCVALEPCTAPVDSLAAAIDSGAARHLAAGASTTWSVEFRLTRVS